MAQYVIDISGGTSTLQKDITSAGKALAGLEKQTQGLANAISGLFSSFSLDKAMGQAEKTVKRTTTTVRKEAKKALLAFDEIERISSDSTTTTQTTSVTTTQLGAENVSALTAGFVALQAAITGALGAFQTGTIAQDITDIRIAAEELADIFSGQNFDLTGLEKWAIGIGIGADLIGTFSMLALNRVDLLASLKRVPQAFSGIGSALVTALSSGIPAAIAGVGIFIAGLYDAIVEGLDWLNGLLIPLGSTLAGAGIGMIIGGPVGAGIGSLIGLAAGALADLVVLVVQNWDQISAVITSVIAWISKKVQFVISGISAFLQGIFAKDWTESFGAFGNVLNAFFANFQNIFNAVKGIFSGIISFVKSVFAGDWGAAWDSIVNVFKSVWDYLAAVVKAPINSIIGFINGLVQGVTDGINLVIEALNGLSFDIPDWVPMSGGEKFGLNLKPLTAPQIPYLAQGAVLPANKPFMAVVGDQKHGTNIEAPLDTIRQAMAEVLANQPEREIVLNFTGDLAQLARVLKPVMEKENRRVGTSLIRRGAM